ncbi:MAG: TIGR02391 family protein [Methanothrix sp.]|uniref:TIGR02391 family protein n=2 Tax=Methanothrix sp. TaxID=90426 RepID=UPI003C732A03
MENGQLTWITNFIWGIADDVLRDLYVRGKYRDVILPMTVIRRLDAVLEPTKQAVLDMKASLDKAGIVHQDAALRQAAGQAFYNTSLFTLRDLKARASRQQLEADFRAYLDGFYFHAVFEATKGLAQRIRDLSGVEADGATLIDQVFAVDRPLLAFNALQTETERSEHKGFAALLKGCFAAIRNPLAHEPKILWEGEDDAADYLSLISLLHRKLDECVRTPFGRNS